MTAPTDSVFRAITNDGGFRVITARTTETVRGVMQAQNMNATEAPARWLAELVTGTMLIRETMAPSLRSQGILQSADGKTRLVADSHPDGGSRGLFQKAEGTEKALFGPGSLLQMMRTLPNGGLQRGVVEVPPDKGLSGALMAYLQESEQVVSMLAVGMLLSKEGEVSAAGGYLVQLLPELEEGPLAIMTERLEDFRSIQSLLTGPEITPEAMMDELLYGMPYTSLATTPLCFRCRCSDVSLLSAMATLPRADLEELLSEGGTLDIQCDYCRHEYRLPAERLRGLLDES